ncbi:COP9 signalosome complex subunit 11 [Maudiozyma exigua]|uniref:COP9 signalosome complex subunit 11 n=1 Tax=Maudiozyma exigua TaxID=34358 RepID=A0A9P6WDG3_MAUEX|nr:COP9 signalosome complex subunit 11 [Kazachstania exigua]
MFRRYIEPVLIERIVYDLKHGTKDQNEKQRLAVEAINYLKQLNYTNSPHWDTLLSVSGLPRHPEDASFQSDQTEQCVIIKKIIAHEYVDALRILESGNINQDEYFRRLECIININILNKDYHSIEEISNYFKNNNHSDLEPAEQTALRKIQLVICSSFYLQRRFFECCSTFFKFVEDDPGILDLLRNDDNGFILFRKEEILIMISISCVVSIPLDNYSSFIYLPEVKELFKLYPPLFRCMEYLIQTKFTAFFKYWDKMIGNMCDDSMFLEKSWKFAQFTMRSKLFFFYIRISTRFEISYISRILNVDEIQAKEEIQKLIDSAGLNVVICDDIIKYKYKMLFQDAVETLKESELKIQTLLDDRRMSNRRMKDEIQNDIIESKESIDNYVGGDDHDIDIMDEQSFLNASENDDELHDNNEIIDI